MSRRNLAAPRSPIGSIIIPFYLHQGRGRGELWGNNSRPKKRYNAQPFTRPEDERSFFSVRISGFGPGYLFVLSSFLPIIIDGWNSFRTHGRKLFPSFQFVSITRVDHFSCPVTCSHPVCSDLVSSRHGKHQTSFFTVLRCITIDRSQLGRHSIRNNSDNDRSIAAFVEREQSFLSPLFPRFFLRTLSQKLSIYREIRFDERKSKLRVSSCNNWTLRLTGSCCRTRPRIERRRNIYSRYYPVIKASVIVSPRCNPKCRDKRESERERERIVCCAIIRIIYERRRA